MNDEKQWYGAKGIGWRIGAALVLCFLCVLATVRHASGAFEPASVPVADLVSRNGMVSGTMRMLGHRLLLYNGTRLESMTQSMEVNFERGGTMVLCPRSQLQILSANANSGIMLAFQTGGAQRPFPVRVGDQVLTPDWRVELTGEGRKNDGAIVQIVTNRHGDLCMQGSARAGTYFRVSEMVGDGSFRVLGGQSERFSDGKMETSSEGCGCDAEFTANASAPAGMGPGAGRTGAGASASGAATPAGIQQQDQGADAAGAPSDAAAGQDAASQEPGESGTSSRKHKKRQHPQDVAGYVRSFVHVIFGR